MLQTVIWLPLLDFSKVFDVISREKKLKALISDTHAIPVSSPTKFEK